MSSTADVSGLAARAATDGLLFDLVDVVPDAQGRQRCRMYCVHVQTTLWGEVSVVRQWGRRGRMRRPRRLVTHHADAPAAVAELERVIRRRLRRGYVPARPS